MVFNPDITKQAIEIVFSVKNNKPTHPSLSFNNVPVAWKPFSKHLGVYMDESLSFSNHIREKIAKAMNGISLLKFLSKYISKDILNMSYKMYVRPHLDYGDVIYHNQRAKGKFNGPAGASTIQGRPCSIWLLVRYNTRLPL